MDERDPIKVLKDLLPKYTTKSGRYRLKELAEELKHLGIQTDNGKDFTPRYVGIFIARKLKEVESTSIRPSQILQEVNITSKTPPDSDILDLESPKKKVEEMASLPLSEETEVFNTSCKPLIENALDIEPSNKEVLKTINLPLLNNQETNDTSQQSCLEVLNTSELPLPSDTKVSITSNRPPEPLLPKEALLTMLELAVLSYKEHLESMGAQVPSTTITGPRFPFPKTLPSYAGKTKQSMPLVKERWDLAVERAKKIWVGQAITKADFAQWLVERFLEETEDLT